MRTYLLLPCLVEHRKTDSRSTFLSVTHETTTDERGRTTTATDEATGLEPSRREIPYPNPILLSSVTFHPQLQLLRLPALTLLYFLFSKRELG